MFQFNVNIQTKNNRKQIVLTNEFGWVGYDVEDAKELIQSIQTAVFQIEKDRYLAKLKGDITVT